MDYGDFSSKAARNRAEMVDKAARITALMERNRYDGNYRRRQDKNGNWLPSIHVAFTDAGFSDKYVALHNKCSKGEGKIGQWFQNRLIHHRMLLDGGYKKELAELTDHGVNLALLRGLAYNSLIADLEDPNSARDIPFRDRQKLYVELTKMEAEAKGDAKTQGHFNQTNILAVIGNKINDPTMRAELVDSVDAALSSARDEVSNIIEVSGAFEE